MSDDRTELTRQLAAECDELRDDNAKLREQVKQFRESIAYASVTIAVLRSQVDDLTKEITELKSAREAIRYSPGSTI